MPFWEGWGWKFKYFGWLIVVVPFWDGLIWIRDSPQRRKGRREKIKENIGHGPTQTHADNRAERSKVKGKEFTADAKGAEKRLKRILATPMK